MRPSIDLNCDLGEEPEHRDRDEALAGFVTSINVACGGHAGDRESMRLMVGAALRTGVALGAHPGYPDRPHFGRRALDLPSAEIEESVATQVGALAAVAVMAGVALRHVKPHGALYNQAAREPRIAEAVAAGVRRVDPGLAVVGLAGSLCLDVYRGAGLRAVAEAFADRRYEPDGSLRPRGFGDALLDVRGAVEQAVHFAAEGWVAASDGSRVVVAADTLCVHADTPQALAIVAAVRRVLEETGVAVRALDPDPPPRRVGT